MLRNKGTLQGSALSARLADTINHFSMFQARDLREVTMKFLFSAGIGAAAAAAGALLTVISSVAFAQDSPGVPGGIFGDSFQLQAHPQLEFAASAPSKKYQSDKPSEMRKRGDNGDPDGCNLQCPDD